MADAATHQPPGVRRVILQPSARPRDAWWVEPVRQAALVVFPGLMVFSAVAPARAGRVCWTVAVASLPLLLRPRRLPSLAPHLPAGVRRAAAGTLRVGRAAPRRARGCRRTPTTWRLRCSSISLWLRLVATNGDGRALAAFLCSPLRRRPSAVGFALHGQDVVQLRLSGLVRREALHRAARAARHAELAVRHLHGLQARLPRHQRGEQLLEGDPRCRPRRDAYFAFPGVVLAFYTYYFLQAGTWAYYFDGTLDQRAGPVPHGVSRRASTR